MGQTGRSGRARNPKSQHYNPDVLAAIKSKGAKVLFLPPKAKYLNPLELLFNDLKQHYIRPAFHEMAQIWKGTKLKKLLLNIWLPRPSSVCLVSSESGQMAVNLKPKN